MSLLASLTTLLAVGKIANMKAKLLFRQRQQLTESVLWEAVVWQVPNPVEPSQHDYKYSLVLIENGVRVLGFDNERGKGDHLHRGSLESAYRFVTVDQLIDDFFSEVKTWIAR